MTCLVEETLKTLLNSGHTIADVVFVGSRDGEFQIPWESFAALEKTEYDDGYGAPEVATDLIVYFKDGSHLERREYDGSEWWVHVAPLRPKETGKAFNRVLGGMWDDLESLNK